MRLLFFIGSLGGGGAERVTTNLANYWAAKGWGITIVTLAARNLDLYDLHPAVHRIALELAGESHNVLVALWQNLRRVRALRRELRQAQPDVALALMTSANVILALAAWGLRGVRAIGSERIFPPQMPLGAAWETLRRYAYARLAAVVALTRESASWLEAETHARRVRIIPNAASWPLYAQGSGTASLAPSITQKKVLLAVGRLSGQKNYEVLIDVFFRLAQRHSDWDLVILGDGPDRPALQSQMQSAKLDGRVHLPGFAGNVGEWYERADLYVMSSHYEGFPNALAEAMAHGLPAVSFDCHSGPRDIIRHEVDGLLVPPGNAVGLESALDRLMGDSALRAQFAARAVEARERFAMARIAGMWEELFGEVGS